MPIYQYECKKCNKIFEKYLPINFSENIFCEKCGDKLKKIISNSTFILKGGGWFTSGYNHKKEK